MERESFASRLGFLLVSAGCAVGAGNVWRFPYITGKNGGAAFVLVYLLFLAILGLPVMIAEFSIGRASRKNLAGGMRSLEPEGTKWHIYGYIGIFGNLLLMMFYTTIAGWFLGYLYHMIAGDFVGLTAVEIGNTFASFTTSTPEVLGWAFLVILLGFLVCALGLRNGVERVTKFMMVALFLLMVLLIGRAVTLEGAAEGLKFYLQPDFSKLGWSGVYDAMGQAFFTLSLGIGSMTIFGSYVNRDRTLMGESINIMALDTLVAFMAGLIIFPTCASFGVNVAEGPGLIFVALPNIFNSMPLGQFWGSLFFLLMVFAAMSTVVAVFENLVAFSMDEFGFTRKKSSITGFFIVLFASLPCILGFGPLSFIQPFGAGSTILDLEDFILSNNLLPIGSLIIVLFCALRSGWGWSGFIKEANTGRGLKFPERAESYMRYVLPLIIVVIFALGYITKFG
ncbi:MAG: sodium-dependent transporter [Candidatus Thermoplasmatota archaeon]|nr:sodium-dependent transporter [Candidatus Thermoplasmatota archaeon]